MNKSLIYLVQTDTTVGFVSQNESRLADVKSRSSNKPFLKVYENMNKIKLRVPTKYKNLFRRSKKTTFVINNQAIRVVKDEKHNKFLKNFDYMYSTSANEASKSYCSEFCYEKSDIIVRDSRGLVQRVSSKIIKLNSNKKKSLR